MQGHGEHSGGSVGLTDHTPPDLNGTVTLPQLALFDAGKDEKSLSGGAGGKAPCGFPFLITRGVPNGDGTDNSCLRPAQLQSWRSVPLS
jgi:hypothetical protein